MQQIIRFCGSRFTSILTDEDGGVPILQDDKVVAISNGWKLHASHLKVNLSEVKSVHLLINTFTLVESYNEWINSIVSSGGAATKTEMADGPTVPQLQVNK